MDQQGLRTIKTLMIESINFLKQHWQIFVPISLVMSLLPTLSTILYPNRYNQTSTSSGEVVLGLLGLIVTIWAGTAAYYSLRKIVEGNAVDVVASFKECTPFIVPFLLTQLLFGIMAAAGLFLLIIPGLVIIVWGSFVSYVYFFENIKYFDAFKRSKELVTGHFWVVTYRLFALIVAVLVVYVIFGIFYLVGSVIANCLVFPTALYYVYLMYKDLKDKQSLQAPKPAAI